MKDNNATNRLNAYEDIQHARRQNFLSRMELKHEKRLSLLGED